MEHTEWHKVTLNQKFSPDKNSLRILDYDSNRPVTVFIIHGFDTDVNGEWIQNLIPIYLSKVVSVWNNFEQVSWFQK